MLFYDSFSDVLSVAFKKLYLNQGTNQIQYLNTPYDFGDNDNLGI